MNGVSSRAHFVVRRCQDGEGATLYATVCLAFYGGVPMVPMPLYALPFSCTCTIVSLKYAPCHVQTLLPFSTKVPAQVHVLFCLTNKPPFPLVLLWLWNLAMWLLKSLKSIAVICRIKAYFCCSSPVLSIKQPVKVQRLCVHVVIISR